MKASLFIVLMFMFHVAGVSQTSKTKTEPKPWIAEPIYLNAFMFNDGMAPVMGENRMWGYINMDGKQVIPFLYKYAKPFSEGVAVVSKTDNEWQVINKQGMPVTKTIFSKAPSICKNGLIAVSIEGKWGYMNKTGKIVISPTYYDAIEFSEGLAAVWINDSTCTFINMTGKTIIPAFRNASYNNNAVFHYGFAKVSWKANDYFINRTGKKITEPSDKSWRFLPYDTKAFVEEMLIVEDPKTKLRGAIDTMGNLIIPVKFSELRNFSDGWARFNNNKKWSYIDKKGNIVMNAAFPIAENFRDGFSAQAGDSKGSWKWYFINKNGFVVPGVEFDEIIDWNNDLALIKLSGRKGFANMKLLANDKNKQPVNNVSVDENPKPPLLKMFRDKNSLYGFQDINNGLAVVVPAEYKFVGKVSEGLIAVTKDGDKWGYIDETGKQVIAYRFVSAKEFVNGKALVEEGDLLNSVKFYIDKTGARLK